MDHGHKVISMDIAPFALRYAAIRYPGPRYVRATGECLPFCSESFDSVTAFEVLEHIEHAALLLNEIRRVLKPNGDVFISTPNPGHLWNALRHWLRGAPYPEKIDMNNIYHLKEYHYDEFIQLLNQYGFTVRARFGQTILLRPFNPLFARLRLFKLQVFLGYWIPKYAVTVVAHAVKT